MTCKRCGWQGDANFRAHRNEGCVPKTVEEIVAADIAHYEQRTGREMDANTAALIRDFWEIGLTDGSITQRWAS